MRVMIIIGLLMMLGGVMFGYGQAIGYIETMEEKPAMVEYVAVNEVPIPEVYDAGELNDYCKYDWYQNFMNDTLPKGA